MVLNEGMTSLQLCPTRGNIWNNTGTRFEGQFLQIQDMHTDTKKVEEWRLSERGSCRKAVVIQIRNKQRKYAHFKLYWVKNCPSEVSVG